MIAFSLPSFEHRESTQLDNAPMVLRDQKAEQKIDTLRAVLEEARSSNVSTIEQLQSLFEKQKSLRRAYINVMDPKSVFTQAYAQAYCAAFDGAKPYNAALEDVQSYVINRGDEQLAMLKQLEDPKFFQEVAQALSSGYVPPIKPEGLPEQKKKVLIDELVQLNGLGVREPAIHIRHTADGHERGHWALAKALNPDGPLTSVLAGSLISQTNMFTPEEVSKDAHKYLAHFHLLAVQVAEAMKPNGEIVTAAIAQSEASRLQSGTVLPRTNMAEKTSAAQNSLVRSPSGGAFSWVSSLLAATSAPFVGR